MRRTTFKLTIEYLGTRYSGWQVQKNSRTVQGEIIKAIRNVFGNDDFEFQGAGRTDAGVHAIGQVAHLKINTSIYESKLQFALNDNLPADVNILKVEKVHKNFHARHDAISRAYIYQISKRRTAFGKNFVWWIKDQLDFDKMYKASQFFIGLNDFVSFADIERQEKSTKVLINSIELKEEGSLILIRIIGSHFLPKMVRRMVGILVEIGRGNFDSDFIKSLLNHKSNIPAKYTAPPSGLFLENVFYNETDKPKELKPIILIE